MCSKRPTAEKLLNHSFFKNAQPLELTVKSIFTDLPPLWDLCKGTPFLFLCTFFLFLFYIMLVIVFLSE
jgi:hypothetical protein